MRSPDDFALSRAVTFFKYTLPYSQCWRPGLELYLTLTICQWQVESAFARVRWESWNGQKKKRIKRGKERLKPNNHSRKQRSQILIWIEVKISDFSLLLLHEWPLNSLSFKMQRWLLTLTDLCLELWMHVTLYSPKDYLKAFWKRNTKIISIVVINSWPRSPR